MTIRLAANEDIPAIMDLLKTIVPAMRAQGNYQWDSRYPNEEVFQSDISLNQLWVAVVDSNITGFAAITTDQDAEYADVGWDISETAIVTHRLAVGTRFRGLGIAKKLLLQAEKEAIRRNIGILRIDTNTMNEATKALFPKLGYHYSGEIALGHRPNLRFCCFEKRLELPSAGRGKNFTPFPVLKTGRLTLRQLKSSDDKEIFALRSSDQVNKYLDRKAARSIEDARIFIRAINENIQKNDSIYWGITLNGTDKLIGTICLFELAEDLSKGEIGYELLPEFQGKGIMQEAASKVVLFGFQQVGLASIEAHTHSGNQSSTRLLEKLSFKRDIADDGEVMVFRLKNDHQV